MLVRIGRANQVADGEMRVFDLEGQRDQYQWAPLRFRRHLHAHGVLTRQRHARRHDGQLRLPWQPVRYRLRRRFARPRPTAVRSRIVQVEGDALLAES